MSRRDIFLLSWFKKRGKKLVGEEEITSISSQDMCRILELNPNDYPFTGVCYPVKEKEGENIQKWIKHKFNFSQYEYFLENTYEAL